MGLLSVIFYYVYEIYFYMIFAYLILSWLPNAQNSAVGRYLAMLVEPYLSPFRRFIPPIGGILDISPIVALFALKFIYIGIISVLQYIERALI